MLKKYKNIDAVPKKYKWDLSSLLDGKTVEELFKLFKKNNQTLLKMNSAKYDSKENFLSYLKTEEKFGELTENLYIYAHLKVIQNVVEPKMNMLLYQIMNEIKEFEKQLGPEEYNFFKNLEKIKEWIKDPRFKNYRTMIERKMRGKPHVLSKEFQKCVNALAPGEIDASNIFSILANSEIDYGYATSSTGKKIKIEPSNRLVLIKHKDPNIRKTTYKNSIKAFMRHKNSFSNMLYQHFKKISTFAKLKKFPSSIKYFLFPDNIEEGWLDTLYEQQKKHLHVYSKQKKWFAKFYFKKFGTKINPWDFEVDLVRGPRKITVEKMKHFVSESVKPYGKEYYGKVKEALENNWVDYMAVKNKEQGAACVHGTYNKKWWIFINYDGTFNSISALAHEMGHSMHGYFSSLVQPYSLRVCPIVIAEIASTFNEMLLVDYCLKTFKSDRDKFFALSSMISTIKTNTLYAITVSNYERNLYNKIDQGHSFPTYESLEALFKESTKDFSISKKYDTHKAKINAFKISHYYENFYLYKYNFGILMACYIFSMYKKHKEKYLQFYIDNFLKQGNSDWPLEIIKKMNIDPSDPKVYDTAYKLFEEFVDKWVELGKKIFKIKK